MYFADCETKDGNVKTRPTVLNWKWLTR